MKTVFVAGATSAIAAACCRLWAAQGCAFYLAGRDQAKLQAVAADLLARGAASAHCHVIDFNALERHEPMLADCFARHPKIDVALVAHGSLPDQAACEQDSALALREFMTNGLSAIHLLNSLAQRLMVQRSGTVAVISSVAGDRGRASNYLYGSAKAAVTTFADGLRGRLFPLGVHVVTVKPGFVATPMTQHLPLPAPLTGQPERVAQDIVSAVERKRDVVYTLWFWRWIMLLIRSIPARQFKRMKI